ncbi:MAG: iron-containing redox enzyme family protein [Burkholderiales bacterium]
MSFYLRLIEATDESRRTLEEIPKVHRMIQSGLEREEYRRFLFDAYHVVWHFCPIMAAAAGRLSDKYRQVRYQLYENIEEEKGHEDWVLNDIRAIGADPEEAKQHVPTAPVQAMIGFNYSYPERANPCGVLGMLYALEVISSVYGGRVAASMMKSLKMPGPDGFTFLQSHASMDQDHMAKLNRLVKTIDDADAQEAVINATRVNFYLFGEMVRV